MREHSIKIETTAHYYSLGELTVKTNEIWVLCHGYGQLAKFFIQKFKLLQKEGVYIIAPEGFNKFYLKGFSGRVGASWMTKEKRGDEIVDHCRFLEQLTDKLLKEASTGCELNVLGFSQWAATVSRWSLVTKYSFNSFILWAGKIANDFDIVEFTHKHPKSKNYIVFGNDDEFYTSGSVLEYKKELKSFDAEWIQYTGSHTIEQHTLERIASKID